MIDRALAAVDGLCLAAAWAAAALLLALFGLGLTEIVLRGFFATSLAIAVEYTGYMVALCFFLGSGWTLRHGGHIRVTLLDARLGPRGSRRLDVACTVLALGLAVFMASALIGWAAGSYVRGVRSFFPSATPLWLPQAVFALGPSILALALLARLVRLVRGQAPEAADGGGPR